MIIEALKQGKVVAFKAYEPRFYKLEDGKFFYKDADDLWVWKESTITIEHFKDEKKWLIME